MLRIIGLIFIPTRSPGLVKVTGISWLGAQYSCFGSDSIFIADFQVCSETILVQEVLTVLVRHRIRELGFVCQTRYVRLMVYFFVRRTKEHH